MRAVIARELAVARVANEMALLFGLAIHIAGRAGSTT